MDPARPRASNPALIDRNQHHHRQKRPSDELLNALIASDDDIKSKPNSSSSAPAAASSVAASSSPSSSSALVWQHNFQDFFRGCYASINLFQTARYFYASPTTRKRIGQCLLLNGCLFLGSMILVEKIFWPAVRSMAADSPALDFILTTLYHVFWLIPLYSLSFVLNTLWYDDIATHAYKVFYGKPVNKAVSYRGLVESLTGSVYRLLLVAVFMAEATAFMFIPVVGPILSILHTSWIYAFLSYDYKWGLQGVPVQRRIDHFERHWAFYAGFGMPCTLASFFFPFFVNLGIYALIFPLLIIISVGSNPPLTPNEYRMPVFFLARFVNVSFLSRIKLSSLTSSFSQSQSSAAASTPFKPIPK